MSDVDLQGLGNTTYVHNYLKLHKPVSVKVEAEGGTHFETPYDLCEDTDVPIVSH